MRGVSTLMNDSFSRRRRTPATSSESAVIVARLIGIRPHVFSSGQLICSSSNQVFAINNLSDPDLELVFEISPTLVDRLSRCRTLDRLLRRSISIVHRRRNGEYLVIAGRGWWYVGHDKNPRRLNPPGTTYPMQRGICDGPDGTTFIGDYRRNPERSEVHIYAIYDNERFDVAWTFRAGVVRHVHAIIADPSFEGRIWVLTGDEDHESKIWYTDDGFRSLELFLNAGQESRTADMVFSSSELVWGMDSPIEPSYICRINRSKKGGVRKEHRLKGPAYYMAQNNAGGIYVGTTVEPGPAVVDRRARIVGIRPDGAWETLFSLEKDLFPQHGLIYMPKGILPENFVVFGQRALKPCEGCLTIGRHLAWAPAR